MVVELVFIRRMEYTQQKFCLNCTFAGEWMSCVRHMKRFMISVLIGLSQLVQITCKRQLQQPRPCYDKAVCDVIEELVRCVVHRDDASRHRATRRRGFRKRAILTKSETTACEKCHSANQNGLGQKATEYRSSCAWIQDFSYLGVCCPPPLLPQLASTSIAAQGRARRELRRVRSMMVMQWQSTAW